MFSSTVRRGSCQVRLRKLDFNWKCEMTFSHGRALAGVRMRAGWRSSEHIDLRDSLGKSLEPNADDRGRIEQRSQKAMPLKESVNPVRWGKLRFQSVPLAASGEPPHGGGRPGERKP